MDFLLETKNLLIHPDQNLKDKLKENVSYLKID